jgi:hypothetical protein
MTDVEERECIIAYMKASMKKCFTKDKCRRCEILEALVLDLTNCVHLPKEKAAE